MDFFQHISAIDQLKQENVNDLILYTSRGRTFDTSRHADNFKR